MLTERALQIFDKLVECNTEAITSKKLALYLGVSERSVKNYIKEVIDYCSKNNMDLVSKQGKGFVANFTKDQIRQIEKLHKDSNSMLTRKYRLGYILYILLNGWDCYTLSLFSEELNVSKKVISEDLDILSEEIKKYNMSISRVAGHGISIKGDEFSIRKVLKEYCIFPIGNRKIEKSDECRIGPADESVCINNFGNENFQIALYVIKTVEKEFGISYTGYSFRMIVKYLCIQIQRVSAGNTIKQKIKDSDVVYCSNILDRVSAICADRYGIILSEYEKDYVDIIFAGSQIQSANKSNSINTIYTYNYNKICDDMLKYLSEMLDKGFEDNALLRISLSEFVPASFVRTKYGIQILNPFLTDVKEMYPGIFATSFTVTGFYEKYCRATPTEHEISFLALYVGGAIVRNTTNVKAILVGTGGIAAASIVARKIENTIEEIRIVAILSSENEKLLNNYDFDIVLSLQSGIKYDGKIIDISPIVNSSDIKKIKTACYDVVTGNREDVSEKQLPKLISRECIQIVNGKKTKEEIIKNACKKLVEGGYVEKAFCEDVLNREHIGPTALGNGVAIPHGSAKNVNKPVVCIIKTTDKVEWGPEQVDLIFLLALNFDNVATTKIFFSDFYRMLESKERMQAIRDAKTVAEVEELIIEKKKLVAILH